jgi:hypothetical protein
VVAAVVVVVVVVLAAAAVVMDLATDRLHFHLLLFRKLRILDFLVGISEFSLTIICSSINIVPSIRCASADNDVQERWRIWSPNYLI